MVKKCFSLFPPLLYPLSFDTGQVILYQVVFILLTVPASSSTPRWIIGTAASPSSCFPVILDAGNLGIKDQ